MPKTPPYDLEFRLEAVRLLRSSDRTIPQLAKELGCSPQSLRNWSRQLDVDDGKADGLNTAERDELAPAARAEDRDRGAGDPEESRGLLRAGQRSDPQVIFGFIAAKKAEHSITIMCRVLEVSRSGFHAWAGRPPSRRALEDARLTERIEVLFKLRRKVYGSPRIWADLVVDDGERIGRKRVERLMRRAGLSGLQEKKYKTTTVRVPGGSPRTCSTGTSPPAPRIAAEWPTSPTSEPGRAGSTSSPFRTSTPAGSVRQHRLRPAGPRRRDRAVDGQQGRLLR